MNTLHLSHNLGPHVTPAGYSVHMENFDVVQALARTALTGSAEAIAKQISRLAERLAESGDSREAKSLRSLLSRSEKRQAIEPIDFIRASVGEAASIQKLGTRTPLPVDRDTGAPLCEVVFPANQMRGPVLSDTATTAYESLLDEWRHQERLYDAGLPISRSLLIYGPPGTGKTSLAMKIAAQLGRPAVIARLDGLISSLLGTTARNLGALFDFCNSYDTVLILDEFDAVAKIRDDSNEVGEIKRVVNALLQNLDKRTPFGLTIAITNHEQLLDTAIWRRFEHQIFLGLPSLPDRTLIAESQLVHLPDPRPLAKAIGWATEGHSGADVKTLSLSSIKTWVLTDRSDVSQMDALRRALNATGLRLGDGLKAQLQLPDAVLASVLNEGPLHLGPNELGVIFDRDRRTVARWLQSTTS
ncbi:ATPase family associated with various cellular activities (AAA) [Agreia sp. VKM Ac-1783]|nr:ATPase family associated with various cellular activities (AAA) [Agreia sp. VKM Ac-1783]